ncbi:Outer membrane lipoprotein omp16 precursor [hydrothermal vent metagenome]|uniref:Outer membrane lipoprotein omp16 n=1 Tax=hydrothermal vent metagenome TaxID=652676 RepID=A0A1W1BJB1_9ZZZZ
MMKRNILLLITIAILIINGCAKKKKLIETSGQNGRDARSYSNGTEVYSNNGNTNSYGYDGLANNVDPYGSGNYGNNNGTYNNGTYDDGTFGASNSAYAGSSIENIYFDVDQYNITPDKLPIINNNANALRSKVNSGSRLKVEGHCDASGSDEYNYALGLRRAKSAKEALVNKGLKADNILMISMGESSPECTSSTSASCYAKNRRVEFKLIP